MKTYVLPQRRLVSQDDAALIQRADVPRSKFINTFSRLTTFNAGKLVPFLVDEVLPGDHMRYNVTAYVRMATALFPVFSNQRFDTFFFYVPYRILWTNWVKFMGEQAAPGDAIGFVMPTVTLASGGEAAGTIYDHMGIPGAGQITAGQTVVVQSLPLRAYNKIMDAWFRDQNVDGAANIRLTDTGDDRNDFAIYARNKSHDYFTSALPWPQKFTPLQTLFTGTAPIIGIGSAAAQTAENIAGNFIETSGASVNYPMRVRTDDAGRMVAIRYDSAAAGAPPRIYADLAQATGVTINALRQAWLVQDLLERDARGGTRYVELIRSHFGVTNPDFRLQRPEYIGGGQTQINITPIAQTTPTGGGGLGALGGTGTAAGQHSASYAATEHGVILGICNIRSELFYQQGLHKIWTRSVRYDHYFPSLAGLGEQAILRQEIYCDGTDANDAIVFGYQERWQEYRTRYSDITGLFRSTSAGNIDEWHLGQQFSPAPTLNSVFLQDTPPMSRILAAGAAADNMQYLADIYIERTAVRPIPTYGTPASLKRF